MQKKPYRNALRSRAMIRTAFVSLLAEHPLEKITVVDVVNRADLSRNTFYAHYQDVYAVLEEFQQEALDALAAALTEASALDLLHNPLPLMLQAAEFVAAHRDSYRVLLSSTPSGVFVGKLRRVLIDRMQAELSRAAIRDRQGLLLLTEVLCAGFVTLISQYLRGETSLTPDAIACETARIWCAGLPLYL